VSRRCLFLDRDGVINVKQPDGQYVTDWSQFEFVPAVFDWIQLFKAASFLIIVVTNQRCVAKKLISPAQLEGIHRRMLTELRHRGAEIDDVFVHVDPKELGEWKTDADQTTLGRNEF